MNTYVRRAGLGFAFGLVTMTGVLAAATAASAQQPPPTSFSLDATFDGWAPTGITLAAGEKLTITATGEGGWGPGSTSSAAGGVGSDCALVAPDLAVGALIARVGSGAAVAGVGAALTGPGAVAIAYNDCPGQFFDNAGGFEIVLTVAPAVTEAVVAAPEPATVAAQKSGGGLGLQPVFALLVALAGAGVFFGRKYMQRGPVPRFTDSARLESSAWLAPVRLRGLQGGRRVKRVLTVGGPDADVDFGLPTICARLLPLPDGGARIEGTSESQRVVVDGLPIVLGQRLKNGARVKIGTREFIFRFDAESTTGDRSVSALSKLDPRAASMADSDYRPRDPNRNRDVA